MWTAENPARRPVEQVLREEKVGSLCQEAPKTVSRGTPLREALQLLRGESSRGAILIVEPRRSRLAGIFTERDYLDKVAACVAAGGDCDLDRPVDEVMTHDPRTVPADETVDRAIRLMMEGGYRHLPVVGSDGDLVGLVSTRDVIVYLAEFFPMEVYNLPPRLHQNERISTREGG